jgi:hypothetical protein
MVVKIETEKKKNKLEEFMNWLWNSESLLSYLVFLILVFIVVKFIFLPGIGLIFQTSLPLAIVESSSMDHSAISVSSTTGIEICGKSFAKSQSLNSEEYWQTCGEWYTQNVNITKEEFQKFKLSNGFRKGDLIIILGKKPSNLKIGDILIFNAGRNHPIIHRIISLDPIQTKGDHNPAQLTEEKNIDPKQVIGVAVAKIPYVGWIKLWVFEFFQKLFG